MTWSAHEFLAHLRTSCKRRARPMALSLVSPSELRGRLASGTPPLLLEASTTTGSASTTTPVIPGAVRFSLSCIDACHEEEGQPSRVSGNYSLLPAARLRRALEAAGIVHDRDVVIYTQAQKAGGVDLAVAARLAWALAVAGVERIALLPGGVSAWTCGGFELADAATPPAPAADFFRGSDLPFPRHPEFCASTAEVSEAVESLSGGGGSGAAAPGSGRHVQIGDVRSWVEHIGGGHDYPFPLPTGRIPRSVWAHWGPSTYVAGDLFCHETGTLHALEATAQLWRDWGLRLGPDGGRLLFYCGSGWRSAVAWCVARLLGHEDCASYDGGLLEWAWVERRPLVAGVPVQADAADASPRRSERATAATTALKPVPQTSS